MTQDDFKGHSGGLAEVADLSIDKAYISNMLMALDVDMGHPLVSSFVLGSFDVLVCAEIASRLPSADRFEQVLDSFETMVVSQPQEVRDVQLKVLEAVCDGHLTVAVDMLEAMRARINRQDVEEPA